MTPAQCRAARALLDWSQQALADASGVGNATIRNIEASRSEPTRSTLEALRRALEAAGVIFVEENGEGPGVRLRHSVHTEEGTGRLLFRRGSSAAPPGRWHEGRPLFVLPKLAKLNAEGWFILEEPTDEDRDRAMRWYPGMASGARPDTKPIVEKRAVHQSKPSGPATDVIERMEAEIEADRQKLKRKP